jgi:hypothetical protein
VDLDFGANLRNVRRYALFITAFVISSVALADLQSGIRNYQEIMAGRKKVEQLSPVEAQEVLSAMKALERQGRGSGGGSTSRLSYEIEVSHNDELFVINGEKFEAKTYCFNMEEADLVIFIDGSPFGACASATLINLRTREKCEVWCE